MHAKTIAKECAFSEFLRLLCLLHEMMVAGEGDSEDADALRDEMDYPWYTMTEEESELAGGLSEDLYSIEENGPKQVEMSPEERQRYNKDARRVSKIWNALKEDTAELSKKDAIELFSFLRRPIPTTLPKFSVPLLQARTWERLGEFNVASLFMKKAEKLDTGFAPLNMQSLKESCRLEEAINSILQLS